MILVFNGVHKKYGEPPPPQKKRTLRVLAEDAKSNSLQLLESKYISLSW